MVQVFIALFIFTFGAQAHERIVEFSLNGSLVETNNRKGLQVKFQPDVRGRLTGEITRSVLSRADVHNTANELVGQNGLFFGEVSIYDNPNLRPLITIKEFISAPQASGGRLVSLTGTVIVEDGYQMFFPTNPEAVALVGSGGFIIQGEPTELPGAAAEVTLAGVIDRHMITMQSSNDPQSILNTRVLQRRASLTEGSMVMLSGRIYANPNFEFTVFADPNFVYPEPTQVTYDDDAGEDSYNGKKVHSRWVFYPDEDESHRMEIPQIKINETQRESAFFLNAQVGSQARQNILQHVSEDGNIPTSGEPIRVRILATYQGAGVFNASTIQSFPRQGSPCADQFK